MDENGSRWQKLLAVVLLLGVAACAFVFRSRLAADFWPLDSSRIGPNLLAAVVQAAVVLIVAALIWPPTRRRIHRFVDRKLGGLHEKVDRLHDRHDEHADRLAELADSVAHLHRKIDAKPAPRKPPRKPKA